MAETPTKDPNHVIIYDTTLRDGQQMPRIDFDLDDRIAIAKRLSDMGVDVIEAGFPFAVEGDFEAASAIAETVDGATISALSRTKDSDIERAWSAIEPANDKGGARIHTFIATSPIHMKEKLRMSPEQVIAATRSAVTKAGEFTDDIEFSPEDASRSDFKFMMRVILEAVDAGATTINVPDTVGFAVMGEYAQRIKAVKQQIDQHIGEGLVVVSAHCHDDLGWATANSLMAVAAGARQVEATIGGVGERASNTFEEEVVANIKERPEMFGNTFTKVDATQLTSVYHEVMERAELPIQLNKAVVGRNAFAHASGIHQHGVSEAVETYEHMNATDYGQVAGEMVIDSLSGWRGVENRLIAIGIEVDPEMLKTISKTSKDLAEKLGRQLSDNQIEAITAEQIGLAVEETVVYQEVSSAKVQGLVQAGVKLVVNGIEQLAVGEAQEGVVTAAVSAINKHLGFDGDIEHLDSFSLEQGSHSNAGAVATVTQNGHRVTAYAENSSLDDASIEAYIKAIDLIGRIEQRSR